MLTLDNVMWHYRLRLSSAWIVVLFSLLLTACAGDKGDSVASANKIGSGTGGNYKVGKPYQIDNVWYYPQEDYSYDETGVASWYGRGFHGQRTANGEQYNKDELTAAHRTLPMPSLARVTNLDNGKSLVVRVNDRGPFARGRIIDVSQRTASLLGFEGQGTAKVRVQVLADESRAIADAMRQYGSSSSLPKVVAAKPIGVDSQQLAPPPGFSQSTSVDLTVASVKPVQKVHQLPLTGATSLYVQAGSFSQESNALAAQQRLAKVGRTSISDITVNGTKFWRVRLGPVRDVPAAEVMLRKVADSGVTGAKIIVD